MELIVRVKVWINVENDEMISLQSSEVVRIKSVGIEMNSEQIFVEHMPCTWAQEAVEYKDV